MYDVIIIGAGSAGLSARKEVIKKTDNYLVIDKSPHGTTCALTGCMPSKVLIEESHRIRTARDFSLINTKEAFEKTMKRVRTMRSSFVDSILNDFDDWKNHFIEGEAKFISQNTVQVGHKEFSAKKIILAVGSRPNQLDSINKKELIDTDSFFDIEKLPKCIHIVGLGPIGLELSQALSNIGVNVKVYERNKKFVPLRSKLVQDYAQKYFQNFLDISFDHFPENIDEDEIILQSIGRKSNIDLLNLKEVFEKDIQEIINDLDKETLSLKKHPHIFICGDSNEERTILHVASEEGKIAGYNAVNEVKRFKRTIPFAITFTTPQLASIGNYNSLKESSENVISKTQCFEDQGRSKVMRKNIGLIELFIDKTLNQLVGAELFCPDAEYMAHYLNLAMTQNINVNEILKTPIYHPTVFEGLRSALKD